MEAKEIEVLFLVFESSKGLVHLLTADAAEGTRAQNALRKLGCRDVVVLPLVVDEDSAILARARAKLKLEDGS